MKIISKYDAPPILFIPGALTGEWIWQGNFPEYLKAKGYPVHTFSFPGHGASFIQRNRFGLQDYIQSCVDKISSMPTPPIVIAHSLGGLVAQYAATRVKVQALILLSPVPATGMSNAILQLAKKSPLSVLKFASVLIDGRIARFASAPLGVYSDTCSPEQRKLVTHQLKGESLPVALSLLAPHKIDKQSLSTDRILFIGATGDHIIPASEVQKSADALGCQAIIYEGMSHTFQIEKDWPKIAQDMLDWLMKVETGKKQELAGTDTSLRQTQGAVIDA